MKTEIIEYTIPDHFLGLIINGDASGLEDDEILQWDNFENSEIEAWRGQFPTLSHWHWSTIEDGSEEFTVSHDMKNYGIGACSAERLNLVLFYN